jgi:photosystem II stability/assembly factor-like uncharacterized protein
MKYTFLFTIIIFGGTVFGQSWAEMMTGSSVNFYEIQRKFNEYSEGKNPEEISGFKQYKRWEYFMESRVDSDGYFRNADAANIYYRQYIKGLQTSKSGKGNAGKWRQLGPFGPTGGGGSGRTNCIAFHPANSNIILLGSASGGIWRSVNKGKSWSTNTDGFENLGISDIVFAQSNPNIVYAATGDRDAGDTYSFGILKSTDAGKTWNITGFTYPVKAKRKIYKLAVHPQNPNIVIAATTSGLRKTTDGGNTWVQIKAGSYRDVKFKPGNPNVIYAATQSIVLRSTDGGKKWSSLSIPFTTGRMRLLMAVTPADSNYLYVIAVKSSDRTYGGLYLSTDGGNSFSVMSTSPNILGRAANGNDNVGQGWYDLSLTVSPSDKNMVFVGGVNIWRSTNKGVTWSLKGHWMGTSASYVHADIHELKFSPFNSTEIWACTDGGVSKSTNNGGHWTEKNNDLSIAQMYRLGASATNANKILTGWQDNGTSLYNSSWQKELGGDGMECIIDYSNNNTMYGSLYYGTIYRTTNGGLNWLEITDNINDQGGWVTPYVQDPNNPSRLYVAYRNVYRSNNKGGTWQKISNFTWTIPLKAIAVAPSNSNVIYVANKYYIYKTVNGGQSWTNITGNNIGQGDITSIAVHATNPDKLWITKSGFYNNNKVYQNNDGGQTWINISGSLPNLPVNTIVYEKNSNDGIYVGMDVGVYYRDTILGDWVTFMKNLPNVIVNDLEIFYPSHKIRAATYGRGLWESPLYYLANGIKNSEKQNLESFLIYPNPSNGIFNIYLESDYQDNTIIEVYNSSGSIIKSISISNTDNYTLDLLNHPKGVYFIRIINNKIYHSQKVILK